MRPDEGQERETRKSLCFAPYRTLLRVLQAPGPLGVAEVGQKVQGKNKRPSHGVCRKE